VECTQRQKDTHENNEENNNAFFHAQILHDLFDNRQQCPFQTYGIADCRVEISGSYATKLQQCLTHFYQSRFTIFNLLL
jgi:hypothetical protein